MITLIIPTIALFDTVAERLFSVILHGFIEYLEAVRDESESRAKMGDVSHPSIPRPPPLSFHSCHSRQTSSVSSLKVTGPAKRKIGKPVSPGVTRTRLYI